MKKSIILVLTIISINSYSQDFFLFCGDEKVPCRNGGINHFDPVMFCPYVEYSTDTLIPKFIIEINQKYLQRRLSEHYAEAVHRNSLIIEPKHFDEIKKVHGWISKELCNAKIKYAFEYYLTIPNGTNFYFTTVYDSMGIMLSKQQFPDFEKNRTAINIIDLCEAKTISEKNKKFKGKVIGMRIDYSEKENSFVWIVQKPEVYKGKDQRIVFDRFIVINALTGVVIDYYTEKGTISCNMPIFKN